MAQLDTRQKLAILADAAKYDASCASSGTAKRNSRDGKGLGSEEWVHERRRHEQRHRQEFCLTDAVAGVTVAREAGMGTKGCAGKKVCPICVCDQIINHSAPLWMEN